VRRGAAAGIMAGLSEGEVMIRQATAGDIEAVLALWAVGRTAHAVSEDRLEAVARLIELDPQALVIAVLDGELVGAMIAAWDGWRGNVYRLAVDPSRRRLGIGTALVRAGEESLRRRGAARVTALVGFEDERAGGFWDRVGYPQDPDIGRRVRNI
jgi:ribosomal protein S18 acetylase RimI-like enzyme